MPPDSSGCICARCENGQEQNRTADARILGCFVLNSVVSFVVILLQFPVDLRGPIHNTDAQNIA